MKNLLMVVTHKKASLANYTPYKPIIVGNHNIQIKNAWHDNRGDNIANKNSTYCELTALYWVWKNQISNFDNIGLCHYRRYFGKNIFSNNISSIITDNDVSTIMKSYDVVLPNPFFWSKSVAEIYYNFGQGRKKDLYITRDIIKQIYPDYLTIYDSILQNKQASYCNMFIMSKYNLNSYCKWLFNILSLIEKNVDLSDYSIQEKRIFGYLSEILLNVWVEKNKLKVKYSPIIYTDKTLLSQWKFNLITSKLGSKILH